jgi:2-isopropylmalate synthase
VQSGSNVMSTASVRMEVGGDIVNEAAVGNGPVDAVYQCINRVTGYDIRIDKYELKSKGEGKDALGQVDIVAEYKGRKFHGMGLATDIVESSAQALIHVINCIYRAEQVAEKKEEIQKKIRMETV